jgi:Ca2+/H+ antiporter, TMEM165/GDT1 family
MELAAASWAYLGVFAAAAVPVLEVLLVIPPAVAAGLHPVPTGVAAFAGNLFGVLVVVLAGDRIRRVWASRRPTSSTAGRPSRPSRRRLRAERAFARWGLPGLAVLAPLTIGSHVAAALALGLRASRGSVLAWMALSLAIWTVGITATSAAGVALW